MTNQPEWQLIAQLGDVKPIQYDGYFIYVDKTGVYEPEGELLLTEENEKHEIEWTVYRFILDQCKIVQVKDQIYLVSNKYDQSWPHPVESYDEWFHKDLYKIAQFADTTVEDLRIAFCSADPTDRAFAYKLIGDYHGYENLDNYPLHFTELNEVEKRYSNWEEEIENGKLESNS